MRWQRADPGPRCRWPRGRGRREDAPTHVWLDGEKGERGGRGGISANKQILYIVPPLCVHASTTHPRSQDGPNSTNGSQLPINQVRRCKLRMADGSSASYW